MRRPLYVGLALLVAAILLVSVAVFKRFLPYAGTGLNLSQTPPVVLAMEDAYMVGLGHDGKLWSAKSRKVEIAQNRSTTTLTDIHDGKIFDNGKVALEIKAGRAVYDTYTKDLQLTDGILISGKDGQKITGAGASWNSTSSTLRSMGQVSFETSSSKVTTDKLQVNLRNKELEMWNIHMSFDLNELANGL